jgi:citrate lyase subunit beta/citryl-CoA lyase
MAESNSDALPCIPTLLTARAARWGFAGQVVLHPTHVPLVNRGCTPDAADVGFSRGLLKAYEAAEAAGLGAVM